MDEKETCIDPKATASGNVGEMDERTTRKHNAFFRHLLFLAALIAIACIIFQQLNFWVGSFLGAITMYIVLRHPMFHLVEKCRIPRWIASLLLVIMFALILAGFGYLLVKAIGPEVPKLNMQGFVKNINTVADELNEMLGVSLIPRDIVQRSDGVIASMFSNILNTTYSFAANVFMMLIVLYFMLTSGRRMEEKIVLYSPFKERSLCLIRHEVKNMIYSNAVGIPLILILQTLLSTLIYWILGFGNFFFWGFLTAICGLIPIVGTSIVYIPIALYMMANGEIWNGVILLAYGLIIISNSDNVFRIILMKKVADTHPLIVIFGVILGIPLFGFWGVIFGPLFISGFILLIKIYYVEYGLVKESTEEELCRPPIKRVPKHFTRIANKTRIYSAKRTTLHKKK